MALGLGDGGAGGRQGVAEYQPEQVPAGAEIGRAVLEHIHLLGQLVHAGLGIDGPGRDMRCTPAGLADDLQAQGVEGGRLDLPAGLAEPGKRLLRACLQFAGRLLVEGQHQDLRWLGDAAVDRIGGLGHQGGSLARAGGGHHLHPVVEADDGTRLLLTQWAAFDPRKQGAAVRQLGIGHVLVGLFPQRRPVGLPVLQAGGFGAGQVSR